MQSTHINLSKIATLYTYILIYTTHFFDTYERKEKDSIMFNVNYYTLSLFVQ